MIMSSAENGQPFVSSGNKPAIPWKPGFCAVWYTSHLNQGWALGETRAKRAGQRTRTVREDWLAWIPNEMDQLFDATRQELESSDVILCISLDEALSLCRGGQFESAKDRAMVIAGLFDRLAIRIDHVIQTIKDHGAHFGTLPNVQPLSPSNFRGPSAQRISVMNSLLAKVVFRERTRFFHKLQSLGEIIEDLQKEARALLAGISEGASEFPDRAWQLLEVLAYDLNTCMGETTIILKSFFCALPAEELEPFREKLVNLAPSRFALDHGQTHYFDSE
jgi:hypothetical protein